MINATVNCYDSYGTKVTVSDPRLMLLSPHASFDPSDVCASDVTENGRLELFDARWPRGGRRYNGTDPITYGTPKLSFDETSLGPIGSMLLYDAGSGRSIAFFYLDEPAYLPTIGLSTIGPIA
jgi:hypothetical protein